MRTVLVVEDETRIATLVADYLSAAGFNPIVAADGDEAVRQARSEQPDLIVLDLGLPKRDGLDVIRDVRKQSEVPIIILTARGDETDRIVGLELGADDYVVKPFSPKELVARVRAIFRRTERSTTPSDVIRAADIEIDTRRLRVTVRGNVVDLTATEMQLLALLASEPGRVFTRGQLLDAIRGVAFESYERAIDGHIKNLRRKIELEPSRPKYIQTVYGLGYRFTDQFREET